MIETTTEQEKFWASEFGSQYIERNQGPRLFASNLAFFSRALATASPIRTCIEFGSNIGLNLRVLQLLFPGIEASAVEINEDAVRELKTFLPESHVFHQSVIDFAPPRTYDLVFTKGLLIHIHPDDLPRVYRSLIHATGRFLLIAEYYNPTPVEVLYRGHQGCLFKRDFAGDILNMEASLVLQDYGFTYRADLNFPQDDITWFLLRRQGG